MEIGSTGADALKAARCLQRDVLVTDVRLPDIDGLEVCQRVRMGAVHTRVVIITAADDPEVEQRALELGASGFVLTYQAGNDLVPACRNGISQRQRSNSTCADIVPLAASERLTMHSDRCYQVLVTSTQSDDATSAKIREALDDSKALTIKRNAPSVLAEGADILPVRRFRYVANVISAKRHSCRGCRRSRRSVLCQNCVRYPVKPWSNTVVYWDTPMHTVVAGSRWWELR